MTSNFYFEKCAVLKLKFLSAIYKKPFSFEQEPSVGRYALKKLRRWVK